MRMLIPPCVKRKRKDKPCNVNTQEPTQRAINNPSRRQLQETVRCSRYPTKPCICCCRTSGIPWLRPRECIRTAFESNQNQARLIVSYSYQAIDAEGDCRNVLPGALVVSREEGRQYDAGVVAPKSCGGWVGGPPIVTVPVLQLWCM